MTEPDSDIDRLREAFLDPSGETPAAGPAPERIWEAAAGRLSPEDLRRVLDEVVASPAAAQFWSVARKILADLDAPKRPTVPGPVADEVASPVARISPTAPRTGSAMRSLRRIAAVLAIFAGLVIAWLVWRVPDAPVYRGGESAIESLLAPAARLTRGDAVLRWKPVDDARRYTVRLFDTKYDILLVEDGLTEPTFRIPEQTLETIPEGGQVLWQVEAVFPDGASLLSPTFTATIVGSDRGSASEGK